MEANKTCPSCGKPIGPEAPQGLCPECLIKAGVGSFSIPAHGTVSQAGGFEPLSIEAVARLFPQLEVLDLIGHGGMGAVYKARQRDLDRLVALKVLPARAGADPGFTERFTREARALARLNHPHIVAVYEFGQVQGLHYFIMEYVDGTNLRQVERSGGLEPKQALAIIPQICEALQFAHDKGVVHRDIKPENILVDREGHVKIADFGLAKILGQRQDLTLTQEGHMMGTPHYMAPEQVEHPQAVDHRADIYSLGVVFYEMLTGELPLGKFAPPSRKVQIDVRLDEVVLRTLEKEPDRRYQQASQVSTEVQTIVSTPGTRPKPHTPPVVTPEELEDIRARLRIPGLGIFLAGLVNLCLLVVVLLAKSMKPRGLEPQTWLNLPVLAALFLIPVFVMIGASQMRRLTNYRSAVLASILAMIVPPAAFIGLPFGIWALVLLSRKEVRQAYQQVSPTLPRTTAEDSAPWRSIKRLCWVLVTGLLLLVVGVLVASVVLPWLHRVRFEARHVFGSTVERRFIHSDQEEKRVLFWDLETDALVEPPLAVEVPQGDQLFAHLGGRMSADARLAKWVKDSGVDLAFAWGRQPKSGWYLMGIGAVRLNPTFHERPFDHIRPRHLLERVTCDLRVAGNRIRPGRPGTLGIRTDRGTPGVLEYDGLFDGATDGVRIRYKLLENRSGRRSELGQPDQPAGPVITRELHASGLLDIDLFDFRTDTVFDLPEQVRFWDMPGWMADRGIDIACIGSKEGPTLTGNGRVMGFGSNICKFIPTESDMNCVSSDLLEQWPKTDSQETTDYKGWDHLPRRFFFKSRDGDQGVLEITAVDAERQGIRFRYRLFAPGKEDMAPDQSSES